MAKTVKAPVISNSQFQNRMFINTKFLKTVGMCLDEKELFKSVNEAHKLKVINDQDFELVEQFATATNATIVDWLIPVSRIELCPFDETVFKEGGYVDLICSEFIAGKLGNTRKHKE